VDKGTQYSHCSLDMAIAKTFSKYTKGYFWSGNYTYKWTWHIYPCKLYGSHSNTAEDTC